MRKQAQYNGIKGMNQDLSISKYSPEFTFKNYNIRLNSSKESTLFTHTNSKGNNPVIINGINDNLEVVIEGYTINYTIVKDYLVLFTTTRDRTNPLVNNEMSSEGVDRIYRLHFEGDILKCKTLFAGNLNFAANALIESIGVYESDEIIKVYWVDKNNQPRLINIVSDQIFNNNSFDFCPELKLNETFNINKYFTGGSFHSGVIQYAFTYWNLNGIESNIFLTTDISTLSLEDRAGSPEDTVSCSFKVTIDNVDNNFDYIRMYAIHRSSLDGIPTTRIVKDVNINNIGSSTVEFFDDGIIGAAFPTESLLFIGGEELIVGTIATKDNTLFGGDIKLKRPSLKGINIQGNFYTTHNTVNIEDYNPLSSENTGLYLYKPYTLHSANIVRHWKYNETYRFGIRAQYKTGIWSEVIHIEDVTIDKSYNTRVSDNSNNWLNHLEVSYVQGNYELDNSTVNDLIGLGFKKVQLVYVPLTNKDRSVIAQGVLTNTLAKIGSRKNNSPFAYPDYFTRGNNELVTSISRDSVSRVTDSGAFSVEWEHFKPISYITKTMHGSSEVTLSYMEVANRTPFPNTSSSNRNISKVNSSDRSTSALSWAKLQDVWFIDTNLLNFWSPDVEHGNIQYNLSGIETAKIRGIANITGSYNNVKFTYENGESNTAGFNRYNFSYNSNSIINKPRIKVRKDFKDIYLVGSYWDFTLGLEESDYTKWLSNPSNIPDKDKLYSPLKKRDAARLVYCGFNDMTTYNDSSVNLPITKPKYIDKTDGMATFNTDNRTDGSGGSILYSNHVEELSSLDETRGSVEVNYEANSHLLFNLKNSKMLPTMIAGQDYETVGNYLDTPYYRVGGGAENPFTKTRLSNFNLFGLDKGSILNRHGSGSGYPYLFIVDLIRNISPDVKYGGNTLEAIEGNTWIPAGEAIKIGLDVTLEATYGDTYLQRYDILRVANHNSTVNYTSEVLSVFLESYINIDGRYDTKRGGAGIENYRLDNYTHVNPVYSQKNNLFTGTVIDYNKFKNEDMVSSILYTQPKVQNELIDKWTNLWLNNSYDADGSLGKINKLIRFNDVLWGFQDKGIFQVLYNTRVQIPASDGLPIEIAQSMKMDGIRYISNSIGATNKWGIKQSNKSLYFIDSYSKDLYSLSDGIKNITEELGFKSWASNNISSNNAYDLIDNRDSIILNTDTVEDDLYANSYKYSLSLSERLGFFETFHSHENIPWMFTFNDKFISIQTENGLTKLWENNVNNSNKFYGFKRPSYIVFYINPDTHLDKTFDNLEYRADILDIHNNYLAGKTFDSVEVWNEYQYGSGTLNLNTSQFRNKKFRTWSFPFPRQRGTLNRIRNPWVKLKLTFENEGNHRLYFHDLIITYNI